MKARRRRPGLVRWALFLAALGSGIWLATRLPEPAPDRVNGQVLRVIDGDSFTAAAAEGFVEVRIAGIDAPEFAQPWGRESRAALSQRIGGGRIVILAPVARDRHGRTVARVTVQGEDVARALVRDGHAWANEERGGDETLLALQADARAARIGLWSRADPVPPAAWRAAQPRANESPAD